MISENSPFLVKKCSLRKSKTTHALKSPSKMSLSGLESSSRRHPFSFTTETLMLGCPLRHKSRLSPFVLPLFIYFFVSSGHPPPLSCLFFPLLMYSHCTLEWAHHRHPHCHRVDLQVRVCLHNRHLFLPNTFPLPCCQIDLTKSPS